MIDILHDLSDWVLSFADSEWAVLLLAVASFSEAIFFPVPPDPLLTGIALLRPESALWLAGIVTVSSVAGALVGHWLGRRIGRPLVERVASKDKVLAVERMFIRYGWWAVLLAAFTPLPYKVFAITAGILHLDRKRFLVASLVGRGARFFLLGFLVLVYGEAIQGFLEDNFELVTIGTGSAMVVAVAVVALYVRRRRARANTDSEGP